MFDVAKEFRLELGDGIFHDVRLQEIGYFLDHGMLAHALDLVESLSRPDLVPRDVRLYLDMEMHPMRDVSIMPDTNKEVWEFGLRGLDDNGQENGLVYRAKAAKLYSGDTYLGTFDCPHEALDFVGDREMDEPGSTGDFVYYAVDVDPTPFISDNVQILFRCDYEWGNI